MVSDTTDSDRRSLSNRFSEKELFLLLLVGIALLMAVTGFVLVIN